MKPLNLGFDTYDFCPLRCNSCPQGRREHDSTHRAIGVGALQAMLERIAKQREINQITLIGWGEPLLHPKLPDLVRIAKPYGKVWVSTTGNYWKCDLQDLVKSEPDALSLSISGMSQAIHAVSHEGGNIEKAKQFAENMVRMGLKNFSMIYHRYNNNLHEEPDARAFAKRLGIQFAPSWGRHHAVEDLILHKGNPQMIVSTHDQLVVAKKQNSFLCPLQTNQMQIDADGNVRGCVVATERAIMGNVLRDTVAQIIANKLKYELCDGCYREGVYKIVCAQTVAHDLTYAKAAGGTMRDRARWLWERTKKRVWLEQEEPREKDIKDVEEWIRSSQR